MNEDFDDEDGPDEDGLFSKGEMSLKDMDDANVPVDIWLEELKDDDEDDKPLYKQGYRFRLRCGCYMPRKGHVEDSAVEVFTKDRETMQKAVIKYIVPFYELALAKIKNMAEKGEGNLYYWSKDE